MNNKRRILEDELESYETQLKSLHSYIKELNDMTARHGTERQCFEGDLFEAEHNVRYYEASLARVKEELGKLDESSGVRDDTSKVSPGIVKQGVGALLLSSISFAAGALLGLKLHARRSDKESPKEK